MTESHRLGVSRGRHVPSPRDRDLLEVIDTIAGKFSRRPPNRRGDDRDVAYKAVQVYLTKAALNWQFGRIQRRIGVDNLSHALILYRHGRELVKAAVQDETLTPTTIANLLPDPVYF